MKNMFRKMGVPVLLLASLSVIIYACSKNKSDEPVVPDGQQRVNIMLTDDPGLFDKVFLDIQKVEVMVDTCTDSRGDDGNWDDRNRCWWWEDRRDRERDEACKVWDSLGIRAGVYDVLALRNGLDTSLATGNVRAGKITRIRITLGTNNSLVKDSISYPLRAVNGQVKIVVNVRHNEWDEITPDNLQLWLDFDVQRSIVQVNRGQFILKPVIHVWTVRQTGSVSGRVLPKDAQSVVSVFNANDTMYALPGRDGEFKVRGLKTGSYSVFVNAGNGYRDTTVTGVTIERAKETKLPTITLKK